jgi:lipopolysaccharide/colanic/teichoic acid biosynthesis glycosyltransferase
MLYKRYGKRVVDIVFALIISTGLSWIVVLILIAYGISFQLPIFFKQKRIGQYNKPFWMWKFRTLSVNEELPLHNRSFWLGGFLRLTSLDELPQLWNVLKGEMSLIGPRPLPEEYLPLYSSEQIKRHEAKPGMTGWAQVNGRNSISWQKKFEMDLYYVNNISLKLDLMILIKTLALLLSFNKDVSLQEEKFKGN